MYPGIPLQEPQNFYLIRAWSIQTLQAILMIFPINALAWKRAQIEKKKVENVVSFFASASSGGNKIIKSYS